MQKLVTASCNGWAEGAAERAQRFATLARASGEDQKTLLLPCQGTSGNVKMDRGKLSVLNHTRIRHPVLADPSTIVTR